MAIRVLEIHHHAGRIDLEPPKVEAVRKFYQDVLGLEAVSCVPQVGQKRRTPLSVVLNRIALL